MIAPSSENGTDYRKHRGVRHTKSGKWGATIRHPITKAPVWLGCYETPKEAADAYKRKKLEYQSLSLHEMDSHFRKHLETVRTNSGKRGAELQHSVDVEGELRKLGSSLLEDDRPTSEKHSAQTVSNIDALDHARRSPGSGSVCRNKAGRWQAEICIRETRVQVVNESNDATPEEAEAALDRKRQEELASRAHPEEHGLDKKVGCKTTEKELVCAEKQPEQSNVVTEEEDTYALELHDVHGESNMNVENVLVPDLLPTNTEDFDTCVINAYGQLVGEFSRLDDELWLGGSLDDDAHNI